jgi:hypothetical protein
VYAYNSGYSLLASGYCVPGYATTVTVVNAGGNVQLGGVIQNWMNGVGMNDAGTKIVVSDAYNSKFYYSYYNGTNWIAATTIGSVSSSSYYTGALTADGTRGVIGNSWFSWTGTTPGSLTSFGTATSGGRTFTKLTADGSRLLMQAGGVMGFYTWNGTTYAGFTSLSALTNLNTNSSIAISPDGTYIAYTAGTSTAVSGSTPAVYFAKWNGTTYANETINVCSGFSSTFNGYTLNWGDFCIGYQNVLYLCFVGGPNGYVYFIALAYNPFTGYFDKYSVVNFFGNSNGVIAASRLSNPGLVLYNTGGYFFTNTVTVS